MSLKKNQPELYEYVKFYFDNEKLESFMTPEKITVELKKEFAGK